jgi:hypothetical protein
MEFTGQSGDASCEVIPMAPTEPMRREPRIYQAENGRAYQVESLPSFLLPFLINGFQNLEYRTDGVDQLSRILVISCNHATHFSNQISRSHGIPFEQDSTSSPDHSLNIITL